MSTIPSRIKLFFKTAAEWRASSDILLEGEKGIEKDTGYEKVGDGINGWDNLAYQRVHIDHIDHLATAISSVAPAENATSIGALINSAQDKTTPIDTDMIGLMDSALTEGNRLKRLSWATIKNALRNFVIPSGGTTGQSLTKASNNNYDLAWQTVSAGAVNGISHEVIAAGMVSYYPVDTTRLNPKETSNNDNVLIKDYVSFEQLNFKMAIKFSNLGILTRVGNFLIECTAVCRYSGTTISFTGVSILNTVGSMVGANANNSCTISTIYKANDVITNGYGAGWIVLPEIIGTGFNLTYTEATVVVKVTKIAD